MFCQLCDIGLDINSRKLHKGKTWTTQLVWCLFVVSLSIHIPAVVSAQDTSDQNTLDGHCSKEATESHRSCLVQPEEQKKMADYKTIQQTVENQEQDEGMGARVRRSIGGRQIRNLDPFLLLDEFRVKKPAGFPDHPHRGFETVTYMISGAFRHEDFVGHKGVISAGDLQWMTAGRGILHCEMPHGEEEGHGLQLWVNLAKANKMVEPAYQELLDKDIPKVTKDGVTVKVIAGESLGTKSPVYTRTPTMYLDFTLQPGAMVTQAVPAGWNGFVFVLSGTAAFGPEGKQTDGPAHHTLVLSQNGNTLLATNKKDEVCRFVLIAGQPLNEPIVQHGPYVMSSMDEIREAERDYQFERNGFENAHSWNSFVVTEDEEWMAG